MHITSNNTEPNEIIIGKCSICSGIVTLPTMWHGIVPPSARCKSCGACEASRDYHMDSLPVIPMLESFQSVIADFDLRKIKYSHAWLDT